MEYLIMCITDIKLSYSGLPYIQLALQLVIM